MESETFGYCHDNATSAHERLVSNKAANIDRWCFEVAESSHLRVSTAGPTRALEMAGDGWRWLEMAGDDWRWGEMGGDAGDGCENAISTYGK